MTIIDPIANTTSELRPRKYQEEIFERAQKGTSSIVSLEEE